MLTISLQKQTKSFTISIIFQGVGSFEVLTMQDCSVIWHLGLVTIINNYSPKAKWILSNNPRDEVEGIILQYSLSLRRIIVLV